MGSLLWRIASIFLAALLLLGAPIVIMIAAAAVDRGLGRSGSIEDIYQLYESSLGQAYLGALGGGAGAFAATLYFSRQQRKHDNASRAVNEFMSPPMVAARVEGYQELKKLEESRHENLTSLFQTYEDVKDLRVVFSALEYLGAMQRARRFDDRLVREAIGETIGDWLDRFKTAVSGTDPIGSWSGAIANINACQKLRAPSHTSKRRERGST